MERIIPLLGFEDTEGIAHIGGGRFAVVEERKRHVVFVSIDEKTVQIERQLCEGYPLSLKGESNKGLEGIAWSKQAGLLVAKEDEPEQLYQTDNKSGLAQNFSTFMKRSEGQPFLEDVAGLHSMENGNILFLSEASRMLLELSPEGMLISEKSFGSFGYDPLGIFHYIRQPEGVTLSDDGRLFVVSEPNQLFIFRKPAA